MQIQSDSIMWFLYCGLLLVALGVDSASLNSSEWNESYTDGDRYFYMPDDNGELLLCDTEAPEDQDYINNVNKAKDVALFMLYTRQNRDSPQLVRTDDGQSLEESYFDVSKDVVVVVHGWHGNGYTHTSQIVKNAYLTSQDVNVIVVDWGLVSGGLYISACKYVPDVGRSIARFLQYIYGYYGSNVGSTGLHLVGHSLGGQVVGFAGRELKGQASRITSLDPALPLWGIQSKRLRITDAQYVEVIHTNAGLAGQMEALGDVDFYPNGGTNQPGCGINAFCSHGRSVEYFAESQTRDVFVGNKCKNVAQAKLSICGGEEKARLGNADLEKPERGIFHLHTNAKSPFGK